MHGRKFPSFCSVCLAGVNYKKLLNNLFRKEHLGPSPFLSPPSAAPYQHAHNFTCQCRLFYIGTVHSCLHEAVGSQRTRSLQLQLYNERSVQYLYHIFYLSVTITLLNYSYTTEYKSIHDSFQTSDYYARNVCQRVCEGFHFGCYELYLLCNYHCRQMLLICFFAGI